MSLHSFNSEWVLVLFGIPTFRCDASLRRHIFPFVMLLFGLTSFCWLANAVAGTPVVWSAMAMAIRVAALLFILRAGWLCVASRILLLHRIKAAKADPFFKPSACRRRGFMRSSWSWLLRLHRYARVAAP